MLISGLSPEHRQSLAACLKYLSKTRPWQAGSTCASLLWLCWLHLLSQLPTLDREHPSRCSLRIRPCWLHALAICLVGRDLIWLADHRILPDHACSWLHPSLALLVCSLDVKHLR